MAIDMDDDILQDFLVEAGEILELLGEQLVELEQTPEDNDLLNAIFRGFHTVKGGAGFLGIDALVAICHKAEDVFNVLRQGDRKVTPELMDVVLQVLDSVNDMFSLVRSGQEPEAAPEGLLNALQHFTIPGNDEPPGAVNEAAAKIQTDENEAIVTASAKDAIEQEFEQMLGNAQDDEQTQAVSNEITEEEFDKLLDALHGKGGSPTVKTSTQVAPAKQNKSQPADEITEEEFEELLDELHGKGKFSAPAKTKPIEQPSLTADASSSAGDITEAEFDALLDELHGKGKFSAKVAQAQNNNIEKATERHAGAVKKAHKNPAEQVAAPLASSSKPQQTNAAAKQKTSPKASKATAAQGEATVRVDTQVLDEIMNMVGELVLVRNRFQTLRENGEEEQISKAVANLDVVTGNLQLAVMKTRMQPIKKVFGRFPRVVRDLARSMKKDINLQLRGEETDLDKNLVEALADPLVHLIRNAVDHGIEAPEVRLAAGKTREGVIELTASQEGDHIQLTIKDDGKGMNPGALRIIAVEKGMMDEESAARLDDKECFNLIFAPGFSTKKEISDVSGRGVGMDVVKNRIAQMNGTVEIDSQQGKGSTIIIKVPLTLAIMPTLMVHLRGGQAFALPLASVIEILDLDLSATNVVDGQLVVMVRERALPLFYLSDWLVEDSNALSKQDKTGHVVVVNSGGRQVGFVVDQLIGQEEVVIKPLGAKLHGLDGLAGATITGDGKIALILDVPGLMKRYAA